MRSALNLLGHAIVIGMLFFPESMVGQHRRVVVRRPVVVSKPVVHTKLVVHPKHPIRRVLPNAIVVRPARRVVAVTAPLSYLSALAWRRTVVTVPASDQLVWQDSESIGRDEGWVDTSFGVDRSGKALLLQVHGTAQFNFAEVTFANGNVQVVDFNEQTHGPGTYQLLGFADRRHVSTVRILAKSESDDTKMTVYLSR